MSDSTALARVDESTAALAAFGFNENDAPAKPTRLELIQPIQSADEPGLIAGRFRDQQSNLQYESMNIVPVRMYPGRVLFPPGGELGAKPICRSRDGILPVIDPDSNLVRQDAGQGCAKCPYSQGKKVGGKWIRSACNETMSFLFCELETMFMFRMNCKGTALSPTKDLKATIRKLVLLAKSKGQFLPPYALSFNLSSVKVKGAKGTFYIPKYVPTGQVNGADWDKFRTVFEYFNTAPEETDDAAGDPVAAVVEGEYVSGPQGYDAA